MRFFLLFYTVNCPVYRALPVRDLNTHKYCSLSLMTPLSIDSLPWPRLEIALYGEMILSLSIFSNYNTLVYGLFGAAIVVLSCGIKLDEFFSPSFSGSYPSECSPFLSSSVLGLSKMFGFPELKIELPVVLPKSDVDPVLEPNKLVVDVGLKVDPKRLLAWSLLFALPNMFELSDLSPKRLDWFATFVRGAPNSPVLGASVALDCLAVSRLPERTKPDDLTSLAAEDYYSEDLLALKIFLLAIVAASSFW